MKLIAIVLIAALPSVAIAEWTADPSDKVQVRASAAIEAFRDTVPRTEPFFEKAYGKGIIVAGNAVIGRGNYWQFTSGIQAGAKNFSMIVFFRDKKALEYFQLGKTQFMGQAGIDVATFGAAGTPGYNDGVAVITMNRLGLMGEFTGSGAKFTYKPLEVSESP
jgi:hypothetical protein